LSANGRTFGTELVSTNAVKEAVSKDSILFYFSSNYLSKTAPSATPPHLVKTSALEDQPKAASSLLAAKVSKVL